MFVYADTCPYTADHPLSELRSFVFNKPFADMWFDVGLHSWRCNHTETCYESRYKYERKYNAHGVAVSEARRKKTSTFDTAYDEVSFLLFYNDFLTPYDL